jgi:hypothetical protein
MKRHATSKRTTPPTRRPNKKPPEVGLSNSNHLMIVVHAAINAAFDFRR